MLDPQVRAVIDSLMPVRSERHLVNLSRGVLASNQCPVPRGTTVYMVRIPSTWCEQKRWNDILVTLPPDVWMSLAVGAPCVMHDRSEKPRPTRATWQGLSWIRFAVNTAWDLPVADEYSRSGMKVNRYWTEVFVGLPKSTRTMLKYWLNYYKGDGDSVSLTGCKTCEKGSANG